MNLDNQLIVIKGTVISHGDQRYSSTHVSGVANASGASVSSTVRHHQIQKIWIRTDSGNEDCYQFNDENIEVLEGQRIAIVVNKNNKAVCRVKNLTTGYYWKIDSYVPKNVIYRLKRRLFTHTSNALFESLPVVSAFAAIEAGLSLFAKEVFKVNRTVTNACSVLLVAAGLAANSPLLHYVKPSLLPSAPVTMTVPSMFIGVTKYDAMSFDLGDKISDEKQENVTEGDRKNKKVADFRVRGNDYFFDVALPWMAIWMVPLFILFTILKNFEMSLAIRVSDTLDRYMAHVND